MKKNKIIAGLALLVLASSSLLINCKKVTEGVIITINADAVKYPTSLQFYDPANPGVAPVGLTIEITGPNAGNVYEISGRKNFTMTAGKITLGVYGVAPSSGAPLTYTVTAKAPGYLDVTVPVTITSAQSSVAAQAITTSMLNVANPPAGVAVAQEETTLNPDGTTTAPTNVETPSDPNTTQTVKLSIPAGTSFKDADGNVLTGGSVKVVALSFDVNKPGAANSFPGGNAAKSVEGQSKGALLTPVAFTTINMNVGGTTVKQFNNPIPVTMTLAPGQINPNTGSVVVAGDIFPVYSYDETTGAWKHDADVPVTTGTGGLEVAFTTAHLCTFAALQVTPLCGSLTTVALNDGTTAAGNTYLVDIYRAGKKGLEKPLFSGLGSAGAPNTFDGTLDNVDIYVYTNTVDNSPIDYNVRNASTIVGSATGQSGCGGTVTVTVTPPAASTPITFNLRGVCDDGKGNVKYVSPDGVTVSYRAGNTNGLFQVLGTISKGTFSSTNIKEGSTYDFQVIYNGVEYIRTRTVQASYAGDVQIPLQYQANLCQ